MIDGRWFLLDDVRFRWFLVGFRWFFIFRTFLALSHFNQL